MDGIPITTSGQTLVRCIRPLEGVTDPRPDTTTAAARSPAVASSAPVLELIDVHCTYRSSSGKAAVDGVTLELGDAEILGIVGESGSGKSTLMRCVIGLHAEATGQMRYMGEPLPFGLHGRPIGSVRGIQVVFQNPASSLNPRQTVRTILRRPLDLFRRAELGRKYDGELATLMDSVRLSGRFLDRYPSELSGGQQQRVALARALAASPELVLCDEIVSSLDVSVQASILDLVHALRVERGVSFVFVTHDLGVVRSISDRIVVMQHGRVVESDETEQLFKHPTDSYTVALLRAATLDLAPATADVPQ